MLGDGGAPALPYSREIYNRVELWRELEALGRRCRISRSCSRRGNSGALRRSKAGGGFFLANLDIPRRGLVLVRTQQK